MRSGITLPPMLLPPGSPPCKSHLAHDEGSSIQKVRRGRFRCGLGQVGAGGCMQRLAPTLSGKTHVHHGGTADNRLHGPVGVDAWNVYFDHPVMQVIPMPSYTFCCFSLAALMNWPSAFEMEDV